MQRYSSESSDGDGDSEIKTLNYAYRLLDNETFCKSIQTLKSFILNSKSKRPENIQTILLQHNQLDELPLSMSKFHNLRYIDVSNNRLSNLPEILTKFPLTSLVVKNNYLDNDSLPKSFKSLCSTLTTLNLSGNNFTYFSEQIFEVEKLKYLYLGSNQITEIPKEIYKLKSLEVLCMGGNRLTDVPASVGQLEVLRALVLSDNRLESLPASIAHLKNLKTLQLHKNQLRALPTEIVALKCLSELSLRDNPLVVRFVQDMTHDPPSLLELAARTVKVYTIPYAPTDLPRALHDYLHSAHHCVNPKCKGVFFDNRVEHIKFVDFCGKYRIPLLQYLCSSKCAIDDEAHQGAYGNNDMMRKVLLG